VQVPLSRRDSPGVAATSRLAHYIALAGSRLSASPMLRVYVLAALTALVLPFMYDIIIRASVPEDDYGIRHELHIALNVLATLVSLVAILNTGGDFQSRLKAGLFSVCINFGALMLLITWFRLYYSRPLLIASFFASIAIVSTFNMLIERYRKRRIGIVPNSVDDDMLEQIDRDAVAIASPDEPSWAYDVVLIDWARVRDEKWLQFATRAILSGCEVQHIAAYIENRQGRVVAKHFEINHAASPRSSLYVLVYKRVLDIALVIVFAPIVLLITGVAAVLVAATMGRPVFYTQKRVGKDGQPFVMYKLRSMIPAKSGASVVATSIGDRRITPLGRMLRRLRIDELPQFYNILVGEMSLVGPRPEQPELARTYANKWPQFRDRTTLRPGITGWAQVRGTYAADAAESQHKLAFDLYYLKHASLMMDVSIMLRTVKSLVTGSSAR
jgi:lipopolysaccharide/colanic/teichoic acid biosynthesis glycosyltransferase